MSQVCFVCGAVSYGWRFRLLNFWRCCGSISMDCSLSYCEDMQKGHNYKEVTICMIRVRARVCQNNNCYKLLMVLLYTYCCNRPFQIEPFRSCKKMLRTLIPICGVQTIISYNEIHTLGWASLFSLLSSSKHVNFIVAYNCLNRVYRYERGTFLAWLGRLNLKRSIPLAKIKAKVAGITLE